MKYTKYCSCGNALIRHDACNGTNTCSDCIRGYSKETQRMFTEMEKKEGRHIGFWERYQILEKENK